MTGVRGRPRKFQPMQVETTEDASQITDWQDAILADPTLTDEQKEERLGWTTQIRVGVNEVHIGDTRIGTFGDDLWVTPEVAEILEERRMALVRATR